MATKSNMSESGMALDRLMRSKEVCAATGLGRTVRDQKIKAGRFPAPKKQRNAQGLAGRTNYWLTSDIARYIAEETAADLERTKEVASKGLNGWLNGVAEAALSKNPGTARECDTPTSTSSSTRPFKPANPSWPL